MEKIKEAEQKGTNVSLSRYILLSIATAELRGCCVPICQRGSMEVVCNQDRDKI